MTPPCQRFTLPPAPEVSRTPCPRVPPAPMSTEGVGNLGARGLGETNGLSGFNQAIRFQTGRPVRGRGVFRRGFYLGVAPQFHKSRFEKVTQAPGLTWGNGGPNDVK